MNCLHGAIFSGMNKTLHSYHGFKIIPVGDSRGKRSYPETISSGIRLSTRVAVGDIILWRFPPRAAAGLRGAQSSDRHPDNGRGGTIELVGSQMDGHRLHEPGA